MSRKKALPENIISPFQCIKRKIAFGPLNNSMIDDRESKFQFVKGRETSGCRNKKCIRSKNKLILLLIKLDTSVS